MRRSYGYGSNTHGTRITRLAADATACTARSAVGVMRGTGITSTAGMLGVLGIPVPRITPRRALRPACKQCSRVLRVIREIYVIRVPWRKIRVICVP